MDDRFSYGYGAKCGKLEDGEKRFTARLKDGATILADTEKELDINVHNHFYESSTDYKQWWDTEMAKELVVEKKTVDKINITGSSLVGIMGTNFPLSHGNYFYIEVDGREMGVINFWLENLEEAIERFKPTSFEVEIFENGGGAIITSPDIPDDWAIEGLFMKYNCNLDKPSRAKVRKYKGIEA
ncbi:MAG: hypothetical protein JXR12_05270 [Neptunomonas phycophila]|uniref:hypothetical protein n=1 Tax=Neptunomonas phycophila TaxID=1572645 RepID=UPI003B8DC6C2